MDELIVRCLRGGATDVDARQLARWREASPENETEYQRIRQVWEGLGALGDLEESPAGAPPSPTSIVHEADRRQRRRAARPSSRARWTSPWIGYGLASAAVLALVLLGLPSGNDGVETGPTLSPLGSYSDARHVTTMSLSDGSVIRLAPESRVEFLPSPDRRVVALAGKAFFAVAGGDSPFRVQTDAGAVTVLGTRFEVMAVEDVLRVVVVEGRVRLDAGGSTTLVSTGQAAYLEGDSPVRVTDLDDVFSLLDWPGGLLIFNNTPLGEVAEEVRRHVGREVRVVDPAMDSIEITAWFADETPEEIASVLCMVAGAICQVTDTLITFQR